MVKIGITIAVLAMLYYAWHAFTDHYVQLGVAQGRGEVQKEFDAYRKVAAQRTTDVAALWDSKRVEADKLAEERDHANQDRIADAKKRVATLPVALAGIRVPASVVRLLNDDADTDHPADAAGPAGPPVGAAGSQAAAVPDPSGAGSQPGQDSSLGLVVEWVATARAMYGQCVDRVDGLIQFYNDLRAAQPVAVPPATGGVESLLPIHEAGRFKWSYSPSVDGVPPSVILAGVPP